MHVKADPKIKEAKTDTSKGKNKQFNLYLNTSIFDFQY